MLTSAIQKIQGQSRVTWNKLINHPKQKPTHLLFRKKKQAFLWLLIPPTWKMSPRNSSQNTGIEDKDSITWRPRSPWVNRCHFKTTPCFGLLQVWLLTLKETQPSTFPNFLKDQGKQGWLQEPAFPKLGGIPGSSPHGDPHSSPCVFPLV